MATDKYPTLKVEIAFTGDRLTPGALTWTNVSADVRHLEGVHIRRGRSSELQNFAPGEATVTLNNRARKYDPRFAAAPYYGLLVPGRPIRITCGGTWTAGTVSGAEMYYGFIDSWPQTYSDGNVDSTVTIHAYDMLSELAKLPQPDPVFVYTKTTLGSCELFLRNCDGQTWFDESGNGRHATRVTDAAHSATTFGQIAISIPWRKKPAVWSTTVFGVGGGIGPPANGSSVNGEAAISTSLAAGLTSPSVTGGRFSIPAMTLGTVWSVSLWFTSSTPSTSSAPGQAVPILGGNDASPSMSLALGPIAINGADQGQGVFLTWTGSGFGAFVGTGYNVADGHVHHVLFSTNGTVYSTYYDGVLVAAGSGAATSATLAAIDLDQYVYSTSIPYATSLLAPAASTTAVQDITVWSKALTAAEALKVYQFGLGELSEDPSTRGSRLLTNVGVNQALLTAPNPGSGTCVEYLPAFRSTLDELNVTADTEGGYLFATASASKIQIQKRYHLWEDSVGRTSLFTITDDRTSATGVPYRQVATDYSAREVQNDITVSATGGTVGSATDSASITAYGKQPNSVNTVLPGAAEATSLATLLLSQRKAPVTRLSQPVELLPVRNPDQWYNVIFAEIGYRVTFDLMPGRVPPRISQQMSIEGITWDIYKDDWRLSLDLAPIPGDGTAASTYLIWDSATYGVWGTGLWG